MPTFRGIVVRLCNDKAESIIELAPPRLPLESSSTSDHSKWIPLHEESTATVNVFVPIIPKTLFYLTYAIHPKPPPDLPYFLVFRMFVNEMEVVTWDCTARQNWQGKTMFSLFDTGYDDAVGGTVSRNQNGDVVFNSIGPGLTKRVFKFGDKDIRVIGDLTADGDKRNVEVKIYRADQKVRIPLQAQHDIHSRPIFPHAGYLHPAAPKRYYHFGLIDPVDKPYAVFKFHYRMWEEMETLSIQLGQVDGDEASIFSSSGSADTHILDSPNRGMAQHQSPVKSGRSSEATEYFDALSDTRSILSDNLTPRAPTPLGQSSTRRAPTPEVYKPYHHGTTGPRPHHHHAQTSIVNSEESAFVSETQQPTQAKSLRGNAPVFNYSGNAFLSPSKQNRLPLIVENRTDTSRFRPSIDSLRDQVSDVHYGTCRENMASTYNSTTHAIGTNISIQGSRSGADKRLSIPPSVLLQPLTSGTPQSANVNPPNTG